MADTLPVKSDAATLLGTASTVEITNLNGAGVAAQHGQRTVLALRTGVATAVDLPGDAANGLDVDVTRTPRAATATLANVAGNAGSVTLQAANAARLRLDIYNDSEAILYVKYGAVATAASFTHKLGPFESLREELYTGIVTGIWDSATGAARMTELTA